MYLLHLGYNILFHKFLQVTLMIFSYICFQIATSTAENWAGHAAMMNIFKNFFASKSCPQIVRYNDFSNFILYFIQKVKVGIKPWQYDISIFIQHCWSQ